MKRFISLLLSVLMLFSVLETASFSAFADEFITTVDGVINAEESKDKFVEKYKETASYSFTAPKSEYYEFSAQSSPNYGNFSIRLVLTDEDGKVITESQFKNSFIEPLTEGSTYIISALFVSNDVFGDITVSVKRHYHNLQLTTNLSPSCINDGYDYYTCKECSYSNRVDYPASNNRHTIRNGKCIWCGTSLSDLNTVAAEENTEYSSAVSGGEAVYYTYNLQNASYYKVSFQTENGKAFAKDASNHSTTPYHSETFYVNCTDNQNIVIAVASDETDNYTLSVTTHEHSYSKAIQDKKPNCKEAGKLWYTCQECSANVVINYPVDPDAHVFSRGVCTKCNAEDTEWVPTVVDAALNESVTATQVQNARDYICFNFTPETDGWYSFNIDNVGYTGTVYGTLYNWDGTKIEGVYGGSASFHQEMSAGKTYTVKAYSTTMSDLLTCTVTEHVHEYSDTYLTQVTCSQNGRVKHRCIRCNYTFEEDVASTGAHNYLNGKCKYCGVLDESYVKPVTAVTLDTEYDFSPKNQYEETYYTFTPEITGSYLVSTKKVTPGSSSSISTTSFMSVTDEEENIINPYNDHSSYYYNTDRRYYNFEAGKTYCIALKGYSPSTIYKTTVFAHEHSYKSNNMKPRCNAYVTETFTCECGDKYSVEYEATGEHVFVETVYAPTCIESGYSEMKCTSCGISYIYNYTPSDPEAHIFKNGICKECGTYQNESDIARLTLYSSINFTLMDEDDELEARFTPDESGYYYFRSNGSYDTYAEMYDADFNYVTEDDDSGSGYNFHINAYLEANKEYRLYLGCFEDFSDLGVTSISFDVLCGKHNHTYSSEKIIPTEITKGYTLHKCSCGDYYITDVVDADPSKACKHTYASEVVEPDCVDGGYTIHYCTKCYNYYIDNETPATDKHSYKNNYCENCGMRKPRLELDGTYDLTVDEPLDLGISSTDKKVLLYFTPQETATYLFNTKGKADLYAVLYNSEGKELSVDDANSGLAKNVQLAFDMTAGERYCFELQLNSGSNAEFTAIISKHTHDFADYIVPATCGEDGIGIHTCKTCFYSYQDVPQKATEKHDFDDKGVCKNCGYSDVISNAIPITDFNSVTVPEFEDYVVYSFYAPHSGTITIEGHSNSITVGIILADNLDQIIMDSNSSGEGMNFRISTEIKSGIKYYLVVNGLSQKYDISFDFNTNHSFELINKIMPTCTEQGLSIYKCNECGKLKYDDYTDAGHCYSEKIVQPTCTEKGYTLHICDACGKQYKDSEVAALSHKSDKGTVTKKATYTATGIKTYKCIHCGKVLKTETIPKLAKKANTIKASGKTATVKYSNLKKKNQTVKQSAAFSVSKAQGKVTYSKSSGNSKITVSSAGKITVKKGLKKGTYKVKVKVKAAGNNTYKAATKTVTVTIKVK